MILNTTNLTEQMPIGIQDEEIKRLRNAEKGDCLFELSCKQSTDIVDTLLHISGIQYIINVAGMNSRYCKN